MGRMNKRRELTGKSRGAGGTGLGRSAQNYEKLLSSKDENVQRKMTELKLQVAELMQQLADEQKLVQTVRQPATPCPAALARKDGHLDALRNHACGSSCSPPPGGAGLSGTTERRRQHTLWLASKPALSGSCD
jgi:hypothetical protein